MGVFDLLADDDLAPVVGAKRGHEKELKDPTMDYGPNLKCVYHNSVVFGIFDKRRCGKMEACSSSSQASPPPLQVEPQAALDWEESKFDAQSILGMSTSYILHYRYVLGQCIVFT